MDKRYERKKFNVKKQQRFILFLTIFSFIFIFFLINTIKADVISVNAGGSNETAITPSNYIEGFFSGIPTAAVVQNVTPPPPSPPPPVPPKVINVSVNPTSLAIDLVVNTTTEDIIHVTNPGTSAVLISVNESNLDNHVLFSNTSLTIAPGQTVDLNVIFVALDQPGVFAGTINIGNAQVLVSLNVRTKLLLFDSNIIVLNNNYQVVQGKQLMTQVNLIPFGEPGRLDVTLSFTIRDYNGNTYLTKTETMLVQNLTTIDRNFDTGNLPPGNYIIALELTYPNGVAPSSAHFQVLPKTQATLVSDLILYLVSLILLILIIILILLIRRRISNREANPEEISSEIPPETPSETEE